MEKDWWNLFSFGDRDPGPLAHVALTKRGWYRQELAVSSCYRYPVTSCTGVSSPSGLLKRAPSSLWRRYGTIIEGWDFELWKATFPGLGTGPSPTSSPKGSRMRLRQQCRGSGVRKGGRLQLLSITLCQSVWSEEKLQRKLMLQKYPRPLRQLCFRELKELKVTDWFSELSWGKNLGDILIFFLFLSTFWAPTQKWHWWIIRVFRSLIWEAAWLTEKPQKDVLS